VVVEEMKSSIEGYAYVLPALSIYSIVVVYSIIRSFTLSVTDWDGLSPIKRFIGIGNFKEMFNDPIFIMSFKHNLAFVVLRAPLQILIGVVLRV